MNIGYFTYHPSTGLEMSRKFEGWVLLLQPLFLSASLALVPYANGEAAVAVDVEFESRYCRNPDIYVKLWTWRLLAVVRGKIIAYTCGLGIRRAISDVALFYWE